MAEYPAIDLRFAAGADRDSLEAQAYAILDDFQPIAIQEPESSDGCWRVFFRTEPGRDAAAAALSTPTLSQLLTITALSVPDEDWARRSQANLTAITVGRITVAPPWDTAVASSAPDTAGERHLIVIDPSMGFGTGHHQTTRLCLALLQSVEVAGRRALDLGTGSGVLAIAAWRLGATSIVAVDNDPDAIQNARENISRNGADRRIDVRCGELAGFDVPPADIITANLTAAVLRQHAATLRRLVAPGGALIISGFSPDEADEVVAALEGHESRRVIEDAWAAVLIGS